MKKTLIFFVLLLCCSVTNAATIVDEGFESNNMGTNPVEWDIWEQTGYGDASVDNTYALTDEKALKLETLASTSDYYITYARKHFEPQNNSFILELNMYTTTDCGHKSFSLRGTGIYNEGHIFGFGLGDTSGVSGNTIVTQDGYSVLQTHGTYKKDHWYHILVTLNNDNTVNLNIDGTNYGNYPFNPLALGTGIEVLDIRAARLSTCSIFWVDDIKISNEKIIPPTNGEVPEFTVAGLISVVLLGVGIAVLNKKK